MACKDKVALEPLVTRAFVKCAGEDIVVVIDADVLVEDQVAVEGVECDFLAAAEHDVAGDVVDACAFDWASVSQLSDEFESVQIP